MVRGGGKGSALTVTKGMGSSSSYFGQSQMPRYAEGSAESGFFSFLFMPSTV